MDKYSEQLIEKIYAIESESDFNQVSLEVFQYQYERNSVYRDWCNLLNKAPQNIRAIYDIPFLPISFFKTNRIVSFEGEAQHYFKSSGTTSKDTSKHHIYNIELYERNTLSCFEQFFSNVEDYCFIALLPSYLEQGNSSLIHMMDYFIKKSRYKESGFYSGSLQDVIEVLKKMNQEKDAKTVLFGVSYALLDLIEIEKLNLDNTIVFETGGMKGRRKEMMKEQLHNILKEGLGVNNICSEYGMCELFSQAYSLKDGIFKVPKQMKILIRDVNDAFSYVRDGKSGGVNVIDLANLFSCSFIETEDMGKLNIDNSFELVGRMDNSVIRGCNLMYDL